MAVQALTFDTYGTVVDWRDSVLAQLVEFGSARGLDVDWTRFLTEWKAGYRPGMDRVNRASGRGPPSRPFTGAGSRSSSRVTASRVLARPISPV